MLINLDANCEGSYPGKYTIITTFDSYANNTLPSGTVLSGGISPKRIIQCLPNGHKIVGSITTLAFSVYPDGGLTHYINININKNINLYIHIYS